MMKMNSQNFGGFDERLPAILPLLLHLSCIALISVFRSPSGPQ